MIHNLHTNVRSIRLHDVTTEMGIDWLDQRAYRRDELGAILRDSNARLVAAFHRSSMNTSEAWVVHIFETDAGSECWATDMLDTSSRPERSNEYGDSIPT